MDLIPASVPFSLFEYQANYREPILPVWHRYGEVIQAVLAAFRPWNLQLSGVSVKPFPANLGEVQITFEVVPQRISFRVGLQAITLAAIQPNWQEAPLIARIARVGQEAVVTAANAQIDKQQVTLSMHLTPRERTILEVTSRIVSTSAKSPPEDEVQAYGFSVYRRNSFSVVDASTQYANSLFVRLGRTFDGTSPLEEIEAAVRADQEMLLQSIGLRIE